jgi:tRNA(Phe) wybutosine-synthesizing methylase Tyw3
MSVLTSVSLTFFDTNPCSSGVHATLDLESSNGIWVLKRMELFHIMKREWRQGAALQSFEWAARAGFRSGLLIGDCAMHVRFRFEEFSGLI